MVGITLSPEQIRSAPPEVRRWLEHEITVSLGLHGQPEASAPGAEHLVAVSQDEALAVLSLIQSVLPAVNVFFELGRKGESVGEEGLEALRLADILRHAHLQSLEQVIGCLKVINNAVRQIRQDAEATLYFLDRRGFCLIAAQTQQSIMRIWQQIIGQHDLQAGTPAVAPNVQAQESPVFGLSGTVPPTMAHLGGYGGPSPGRDAMTE